MSFMVCQTKITLKKPVFLLQLLLKKNTKITFESISSGFHGLSILKFKSKLEKKETPLASA